jgi:hypothetical protein
MMRKRILRPLLKRLVTVKISMICSCLIAGIDIFRTIKRKKRRRERRKR